MPLIKIPRRVKTRLAVACLVPVMLMFAVLSYAQLYIRCSNDKNRQFIDDLCTLYRNGAVVGGMCNKLCDQGAFRFEQCGNNRWGKHVIVMTCRDCDQGKKDINVVLKSQHDMATWENFLNKNSNASESLEEAVNYVYDKVVARFRNTFGVDFSQRTPKELMSFMWDQDFEAFVNAAGSENAGKAAALNILSLAIQQEYMSLKILDNSKYLPHLYGTCGPAYFVEYTPSFTKLGYVLFQGKLPELLTAEHTFAEWNDRAVAALKILKLIKDFETSFHAPLHLCDLKSHNFAMNSLNDISLLDTDSIRFENKIGKAGLPCNTDRDCDWLVCEASCNTTSRMCGSQRKNNNLQSICYHLFLSEIARFGLLRNPPRSIERDLRSTLAQCAEPTKYKQDHTGNKASLELLDQLERILLSSLSTQS